MSYLIPGVCPEGVLLHLRDLGLQVDERIITAPREAVGYVVPESEDTCVNFLRISGLTRADFRRAVATNIPDLLLVETGQPAAAEPSITPAPQEDIFQRSRFIGLLNDGVLSPRTERLLHRLTSEYHVNIFVEGFEYSCFDFVFGCRTCRTQSQELRSQFERSYPGLTAIELVMSCRGHQQAESVPTMLYDYPIDNRSFFPNMLRETFSRPSGDGVVIRDNHGTAVAEVIAGQIQLLFKLLVHTEGDYRREPGHWSHDADVLEKILTEAIPIAMEQVRQQPDRNVAEDERRLQQTIARLSNEQAAQRNSFLSIMGSRREHTERFVRRELANAQESLRLINAQLAEAYRNLEARQLALTGLLNQDQTERQSQLEAGYQRILDNPLVIGLTTSWGWISVHTGWIFVDHNGHRYRMGRYSIDVNFNERRLKIPLQSRQPANSGHPHPHVRGEEPCLGNIGPAVSEMLYEWRFEELIELMLDFLQSYNPSSPFEAIEHWPRVD